MKRIEPEQMGKSVFEAIGKDWMLIGAGGKDRVNAMTASWGGMGVLWGKPVVFAFIRPQRFTKTFVDDADFFSLSFFGEERRKMMSYMGAVSGRDEDKIAHCGLTPLFDYAAPVFKEARLSVVCRKLYAQEMRADCFLDREAIGKWYPDEDFHTMYVGEIVDVLTK